MSATNYALLIPRVRALANDTPTSNPKFGDVPSGLRDGSNKTFRLAFPNVVAASLFMTYGAAIIRQPARVGTFAVLDQPTSYITATPAAAAPDADLTQPFFFDYFFQFYPDADYQSFLDEGTNFLGGTIGVDVDPGLYPAQVQYALSCFYERRASDKAKEFASSGGGLSTQPQTPGVMYTNLAKMAYQKAIVLRDDFYKRQGQRNAPASGTVHSVIDTGQTPY